MIIQLIRFSITGGINAVVDFTILNLLIKLAGWGLLAANTVSFSAAVVCSYFLNKYWTFADHRPRHLIQFPIFIIISLVGLGLSNLLVHLGTSTMEQLGWWSFTINYNVAKAFSAGIVLVWNFTAYKYLAFRR